MTKTNGGGCPRRRHLATVRAKFLRLYKEGHLIDPKTGKWMSTYYLGRLLDVPGSTAKRWIDKHCPDYAAALAARGKNDKATVEAKKAAMRALIEAGEHVSSCGFFMPAYLLAHDLNISPTTFMKWAWEMAPELAARWREGHCNHWRTAPSAEMEAQRANQRASARKQRQYSRRTNTRRLNEMRRELDTKHHNTETTDDTR
ncbi:hypothetical protein ABEG18_14645 [Alsobacter sp. KACC 23698]|uniref:Uncharacterized protein n=1 Tax=Alsobacter sp. KACC 23698 TaxID=3149229 RepID=A0AAU7J9J6_9HYPH